MDNITILGVVAAFFTTAAFIPQAIKVIKTKHTQDLSLIMYIMFVLGILLWLTYGISLKNIPIILSNSITLIFAASILFLKIKYK